LESLEEYVFIGRKKKCKLIKKRGQKKKRANIPS